MSRPTDAEKFWNSWAVVYYRELAKGMDQADAAHRADEYCDRKYAALLRERRTQPVLPPD